jgi:hypothetical protein
MITVHLSTRFLVVGALALNLAVGPLCVASAHGGCPVSEAKHEGPACCCADHCHCANCPAAHPNQQQPKKATPVNLIDSSDSVKSKAVAIYSLFWNVSDDAAMASFPSHFSEGEHHQTLISQHTCLRV